MRVNTGDELSTPDKHFVNFGSVTAPFTAGVYALTDTDGRVDTYIHIHILFQQPRAHIK